MALIDNGQGTDDQKRNVGMFKKVKKERHLLQRLYLAGFSDIYKAKSKVEKAMWWAIIVVLYLSAICLAVWQISRYQFGRTTGVFVSQDLTTTQYQHTIPQMTLCHSGKWNKTFVEQNLNVSDDILRKAEKLQLTKKGLLSEFVRYLDYFSMLNTDVIDEQVWALLNELFEHNFGDMHFADFVADAAYRGKRMFVKCTFKSYRYPCDPSPFTMDTPSCYMLPDWSNRTSQMRNYTIVVDNFDDPSLTYEVHLDKKHIFDHYKNADTQNTGVRLIFGVNPTPFTSQLVVPANTHAIVTFQETRTRMTTDCYGRRKPRVQFFRAFYTQEICMVENLERLTMDSCGCHFIAGDYYPRNAKVCTPDKTFSCVQPKVLEQFWNYSQALKTNCKRPCQETLFKSSSTFYTLHGKDDDSVINRITLRPQANKRVYQIEQNLFDIYSLALNLGCGVYLYTGFSFVALVHAVALIGKACVVGFHRKAVRPVLGQKVKDRLPLATLWHKKKVLHHQNRSRIPVRHNARVYPM